MTAKLLCLALLGAAPISVAQAPVHVELEGVELIDCGNATGTAWRSGTGAYTTANHVVAGRTCTINGYPLTVTWADSYLDIAFLRTEEQGRPLTIDCGGYRDGEVYAGVGHALGKPEQRAIFILMDASIDAVARWNGFTAMVGEERFIPGMSGGPVYSRDGRVVGIVNGYSRMLPISFTQSLSATPLCK